MKLLEFFKKVTEEWPTRHIEEIELDVGINPNMTINDKSKNRVRIKMRHKWD